MLSQKRSSTFLLTTMLNLKYFVLVISTIAFSANFVVSSNNEDDIWRPCPKFDAGCIQDWFQKNGRCNAPEEKPENTFITDKFSIYFQNENVTKVELNRRNEYTESKIIEFYVNKKTRRTVLAVEFNRFFVNGILHQFHYSPRIEPVIVSSNITEEYANVTTTTVFKGIRDVDLKYSTTSVYLETMLKLDLGDGILKNRNPEVIRRANFVTSNIDTSCRELYLSRAAAIAAHYIQNRICDFGVPILRAPFSPVAYS